MYTTILHPLRKAYNLSIHEYCVLDSIYVLSHNIKYSGWCIASKKRIADELDLAERTVFNAIETLLSKGLVIKSEAGFLQTVDEWNEAIANKKDYAIAFNGKESKFISGNAHQKAEVSDSNQHIAEGMQKMQRGYAKNAELPMQKMQTIIDIDNNKIKKARTFVDLVSDYGDAVIAVKVTAEELQKLINKFGNRLPEYLKTFGYSIVAKNYGYKNHYMAILKWFDKPEKEKDLSFYKREYEEMQGNSTAFIKKYGLDLLLKIKQTYQ